jgi:hypothetical protein
MPQAIVLACNLRRVAQACFALLWTAAIVLALSLVLNWRATGDTQITPEGLDAAWQAVFGTPVRPGQVLFWVCVLAGWWLGFGYLNAPVLRGAALEIARDERGKLPPEPLLYRMAAGAPLLAMLIPAVLLVAVAILVLPAHLDGLAGSLLLLITLPLALVCALVAAAGFLLFGLAAPLMPATAVVEGRDYLEALSRPAGFVLQKPFRYAAYFLAKLAVVALAAVAGGAVLALAWLLIAACLYAVGASDVVAAVWAAATDPAPLTDTPNLPPFVMASIFWGSVGMLVCWLSVVSQCADLITYLLLRYRIEGTTFDQVMVASERLALFPTATETAAQAEEARQRFDARQAAQAAPKAEPAGSE